MSDTLRVLMRKTIQPRFGKRLLEGEIYPLPQVFAERLEHTGVGEILRDDEDNDGAGE